MSEPETTTAQVSALGESGHALAELLLLCRRDYRFVTPTAVTHARVLARDGELPTRDLRVVSDLAPVDGALDLMLAI